MSGSCAQHKTSCVFEYFSVFGLICQVSGSCGATIEYPPLSPRRRARGRGLFHLCLAVAVGCLRHCHKLLLILGCCNKHTHTVQPIHPSQEFKLVVHVDVPTAVRACCVDLYVYVCVCAPDFVVFPPLRTQPTCRALTCVRQ